MAGRYATRRAAGMLGTVACLAVVACTGSDAPSATSDATLESTAPPPSDEFSATSDPATPTTVPRVADGPLGEACPATIAVQAATLPEPAMGPLYSLLGPDPIVDVEAQTVSAPLVRPDGTPEDVVLEIRSGGPAVGFRSPLSLLTSDGGLMLAQVSTAEALRDAETVPSTGVVTLTDRSRDALIVDPATYPDADTVEAVGAAGIEVRHRTDAQVIDYLTAIGALTSEQLVPGFDGEPAAFVQSGGTIAQQGDLLIEPVLFTALPQWGRPVTAIAASASGWDSYDDALVARADDVEGLETCLGRFVPIIQGAIIAYVADPSATNQLMARVRSSFAPLSRLTPELLDAGVVEGTERGVFNTDDDHTVGGFDVERLDRFLPELASALDVDALAADDLVTDQFVDPEITSGG